MHLTVRDTRTLFKLAGQLNDWGVCVCGCTARARRERARRLYYAVRERVRYDPYSFFRSFRFDWSRYRVSRMLKESMGGTFCHPKVQRRSSVHCPLRRTTLSLRRR